MEGCRVPPKADFERSEGADKTEHRPRPFLANFYRASRDPRAAAEFGTPLRFGMAWALSLSFANFLFNRNGPFD